MKSLLCILSWLSRNLAMLGCIMGFSVQMFADGIRVEQVQRDYQIRYHLVTGQYLQWPNCSHSSTPTPQYPKDGYYGNLDENPEEAVVLVKDLVQKFYVDKSIYTYYINSTSDLSGLEGAVDIVNYGNADFTYLDPEEITVQNYPSILSITALDVLRLKLLKVQASQLIATDWSDTKISRTDDNSGTVGCLATQTCASDSQSAHDWGYGQFGDADSDCALYDAWFINSPSIGIPNYDHIGRSMEAIRFDYSDSTFSWSAFARNTRGKLYADLTQYKTGKGAVFLKLSKISCSEAYFPDFQWYNYNDVIACASVFAQDRPTSADEDKYGEWSDQSVPLGDIFTSDYVTYSDSPAEAVDSCASNTSTLFGWEVSDALIIVQPDFTTTQDPQNCCGCAECEAGSVTFDLHSLHINIGLGVDSFDGSAGNLTLSSEIMSPELTRPSGLRYSTAENITIITNSDITHLQFRSSQRLADVETNNTYSYEIKFYLLTDVGILKTNGFYNVSNEYSKIIIANPDGSANTNRLRVSEISGGFTNVIDYTYVLTNKSWEMVTGGGLRAESREIAWDLDSVIKNEVYVVKGETNQVVYKEKNVYKVYDWGQELLTNIVNPDGFAITNVWTFYTNSLADGGNYRHLREKIEGTGHWTRYQYDEFGRETNRISQFLNSAIGSDATNNRQTITVYSTNTPQVTIVNKILGTEVSRSYKCISDGEMQSIQCQTVGAPWDDSNNLVTRTTKYTNGSFAGQIKRIINPDSTVQIYLYSTNASEKTTIYLTGVPDNGNSTNIVKGVIYQTTVALDGKPITKNIYYRMPSLSDVLVDQDVYTYLDPLKRSYQVVHLDGSTNIVNYACCGLESEVDREGTETTFFYDALKRQIGTKRNGIIITNLLDATGAILRTVRVGTNGTLATMKTATYDQGGRIIATTDANQETTLRLEGRDSNGQLIVTNIYPNMGTRVETFAQDGSMVQRTGSAVRPIRYTNSIETFGPDGGRFYVQEIRLTGTGADTDEWIKSYTDALGRTYKTLYNDGGVYRASFNNKGQLESQANPDEITTLYAYNDLGERSFVAIDMNLDGVINFNGEDRITQTTNDVVFAHGTDVLRERKYVWQTNNSDAATLVFTKETSVDGLKTWTHTFGITNSVETIYGNSGLKYITKTLATGDYAVTRFDNGMQTWVYQFDEQGNQLAGRVFDYDHFGRLTSIADELIGPTTFTFNSDDQISSITSPSPGPGRNPQITTNYFDVMGRIWKVGLPDSTFVTNVYSLAGDRFQTSGSGTYPVQYNYDAQGRITNMVTWQIYPSIGASSTRWFYNSRGFVTNKLYADGNGPSFSYTAAGKLAVRTWARGVATQYHYNNAGEVKAVTYSDNTDGLTNQYSRTGQLMAVTQGTNTTSFIYGYAGELLSETRNAFIVTNCYDSFLRRTNVAVLGYPGTAASYGYDSASRLEKVMNGDSSVEYTYWTNSSVVKALAFNESGNTRLTRTNSYDYVNRITEVENYPQNDSSIVFSYDYDSADRRVSVRDPEAHWVYIYDIMGQITSGRKYWNSDDSPVAGQNFEYSYDDIGNRKHSGSGGGGRGEYLRYTQYKANLLNEYTEKRNPGWINITGSATNNAIVTVNNTLADRKGNYFRAELAIDNSVAAIYQSVTNTAVLANGLYADVVTNIIGKAFIPKMEEGLLYDLDGNLTNDGRWQYIWDAENRLIGMIANPEVPTNAKLKLTFSYDYRNRRSTKSLAFWDGTNYIDQWTNRFCYDGGNLLLETDSDANPLRELIWSAEKGNSKVVIVQLQGTPYYVVADGNDNVTALIRSTTGKKAALYEYGPFGELIAESGTIASQNPIRFSMKYTDTESALVYYGSRYYNPVNGVWLGREPLMEVGANNLYSYTHNDAINFKDSQGMYEEGGHYYTTYIASMIAQKADSALGLAFYSQMPDELKSMTAFDHLYTTGPKVLVNEMSLNVAASRFAEIQRFLHSLDGGDAVKRRKCLAKLISDPTNELWERGLLIHALGDAYAHSYIDTDPLKFVDYGFNSKMGVPNPNFNAEVLYPSGVGHGWKGHSPDYVTRRLDLYSNYLTQLVTILNGQPLRVDQIQRVQDVVSTLGALPKNTKGSDEVAKFREIAVELGLSSTGYQPELSDPLSDTDFASGPDSQYNFKLPTEAQLKSLLSKIQSSCCP